ncbi:hypothetical protein HPP92_023625 [Vanilla planifolia]|uniref:Uncharacterized protein n=1 Tax=Vanilla planifolia TaxID=51239 RepID=A0A835UEM6_VANPL|nr:hypothetical protein HPP92_023625 [Vanilla planifolia]
MASEHESSKPLPTKESGEQQSSISDIFSSAQVFAGAAKSAFSQDGSQVEKAKVAKAGEELLDATSKYGKLEEKGYGSYVEKAEGFLQQFQSSETPVHSTPEKAAEVKEEQKNSEGDPSGGGVAGLGGEVGGYLKAAKGFFK